MFSLNNEWKRIQIFALISAGHKLVDIVKMLNVNLSTVKWVANRKKNNESLKYRRRSRRPKILQQKSVRKSFEGSKGENK